MRKRKENLHLVLKRNSETRDGLNDKPIPSNVSKELPTEHAISDTNEEINLYRENALELSGMSFQEKLAYKKQLRSRRLASMDSDEKKRYIFHYYKWHLAAGILCIFLLCWIGKTIYTANLPRELILAITNDGVNITAEEYIPDTFRDYYDLDNKNIIQIFTDLTIDNAEDAAIQDSTLTDYEKVIVYITSDKLDAIIGDGKALDYYKSTGDIAILDACLDARLYEQIEEHIVQASDETSYMNNGKPYAAAIDISSTEFARKCNLSYDDVYLMIPNNRYTNNEATINLIRLIFKL